MDKDKVRRVVANVPIANGDYQVTLVTVWVGDMVDDVQDCRCIGPKPELKGRVSESGSLQYS